VKATAAQGTQVMSIRLHPAVIERLDGLLEPLQTSKAYQLRGLDSRMDVIRLALELGITALEKEVTKK